jgi:MFS family permease
VLLSRLREPPREALRPPARFFHPAGVAPGFVLLWTFAAMAAVMTFAPLFAVANGLANPGLFFTAYSGGSFLGQTVGGRAADRFDRAAVVVPGLLLATVGVMLIPATGGAGLVGCSVLIGFGFALAQPGLFADVMDRATPAERGAIFATSGVFIEVGVAVGPTLLGVIAEGAGLDVAFRVLACGHAASGAAFLLLRRPPPARDPRPVSVE